MHVKQTNYLTASSVGRRTRSEWQRTMKPRYRLSACPSLLLSLVLSVVVLRASASRVLLISTQVVSHLLELRDLGVSLAARGHEVWMTLETDHPMSQPVAPRPLHIITYRLSKDAARLSDRKCHNDLISLTPSELLQNDS